MAGAGPVHPQGRSVSGGPAKAAILERSGREEARRSEAQAGGENSRRSRFHRTGDRHRSSQPEQAHGRLQRRRIEAIGCRFSNANGGKNGYLEPATESHLLTANRKEMHETNRRRSGSIAAASV